MAGKSKAPSKSKAVAKKGESAVKEKAGGKGGDKGSKGKGPGSKKGNNNAGKKGKGGKGGKGKKGKKKKGKRKKKKGPRCPIKRRKKALKRKCTDMLAPDAVLNTYYTCHGVTDMLRFRKFKWKKKKK